MSDYQNVEQLYKNFDNAVSKGSFATNNDNYYNLLQIRLDEMLAKSTIENRTRVSTKILWRLVSTIKNAKLKNNIPSEHLFFRLLNQNSKYFIVSKENKDMVSNIFYKKDIYNDKFAQDFLNKETSAEENKLLDKVFAKENKRKRDADKSQLANDAIIENPNVGLVTFKQNANILIDTLMYSDIQYIHLSDLYESLELRGNIKNSYYQNNLFEPQAETPQTIDKRALQEVTNIYATKLSEAAVLEEANPNFVYKFQKFLKAAIHKNSFTKKEVEALAETLEPKEFVSKDIEDNLINLGSSLIDIYNNKQTKDINSLLAWDIKNPAKKPITKTAHTKTFVDALHQRFITDESIKNFNDKYTSNRNNLKTEITNNYSDKKDFKETEQNILNYTGKINSLKFTQVNKILNEKFKDEPFYSSILAQAQENGLPVKKVRLTAKEKERRSIIEASIYQNRFDR